MSLPIHDWQFWVATVIAILALRHVLKMLFPSGLPLMKKRAGGKGTRTTLTVDRKPVDRSIPTK
ncbi:MAG TPA: hypothetical protein VK176_02970 [Phycisphaerales bacterium]|nr:hypothetical protein [Phycisphaerales bacterium]